MKTLLLFFLSLGMFLNVGSSRRGNDLFQVITSHPHDVEELLPYIETVHQNGRLWVVQLKAEAPAHIQSHLRPLGGHEKSYIHKSQWFSHKSLMKKDFLSLDENKEAVEIDVVTKFLVEIDKEAIKQDVMELASFKTRAAGTTENYEAVQSVKNRFESMGYETKEICYREKICSIIAEKKGSTGKVMMIMGHVDSVGADFAGADDNASGTAVILEMARVLKDYQNKNTIRFFVTNGEENGLVGSTHYANYLAKENKLIDLGLVINMDMVGYNSNGVVELETNPRFEELAKWFGDLTSKYTKLKAKITLGAWGSDHVPFLDRGVPSLLTIENWATKTPCYHKKCDLPDTLNYEYAAEIAKLNTAAILLKDR
jgi:hypothetical protein